MERPAAPAPLESAFRVEGASGSSAARGGHAAGGPLEGPCGASAARGAMRRERGRAESSFGTLSLSNGGGGGAGSLWRGRWPGSGRFQSAVRGRRRGWWVVGGGGGGDVSAMASVVMVAGSGRRRFCRCWDRRCRRPGVGGPTPAAAEALASAMVDDHVLIASMSTIDYCSELGNWSLDLALGHC